MIKLKRIIKEVVDALPPALIQHQPHKPQAAVVVNQKMVDDAYILTATIWSEARGDGEKGMQAVLNVILNRSNGDFSKASEAATKFSTSKKGKKIHQFSCWNGITDPVSFAKKLSKLHYNGKEQDDILYTKAIELVDKSIKHQLQDITKGAGFYFNPSKAHPSWAKKLIKTASIGHHDFYKAPPKKV